MTAFRELGRTPSMYSLLLCLGTIALTDWLGQLRGDFRQELGKAAF